MHRRHPTASQRAMAVAACATWMTHGGEVYKDRSAAAALRSSDELAPKSLAALAEHAGVSRRTMAEAAELVKQGAPQVKKEAMGGALHDARL